MLPDGFDILSSDNEIDVHVNKSGRFFSHIYFYPFSTALFIAFDNCPLCFLRIESKDKLLMLSWIPGIMTLP